MRIIILLLFVCSAFSGDAPVNPAIKPTMDAYETDAAKAYAEYLKATSKVAEKAIKDLDTKFKAAMKKGDLDTANAIKSQMDDINNGKSRADLENKWKQKIDAADLLTTPGSIRVISATFSAAGQTVDVTEMVQEKFDADGKKPFVLDAKVFGDPVPGSSKTLTIVYSIDGKKKSANFQSWDTIDPSEF